MRVMFTVAVLLTGIACISRAEAQVCGGDCNRCLVYARGECIKRGADPACEALKKRCLAQRKAPMGAPKPATTAAPRPTCCDRPTPVPPAPSVVRPTLFLRHRVLRDRLLFLRHRVLCDRLLFLRHRVLRDRLLFLRHRVLCDRLLFLRHRVLCDRLLFLRHRLLCDRHRLLHRHPASYLHEYICAPPTYRHPQLVHMASWPFVPNRRRQIVNDYSGRAWPTAQVCRHRRRCLALSHQAIKCSRSGPSTNQTQATH